MSQERKEQDKQYLFPAKLYNTRKELGVGMTAIELLPIGLFDVLLLFLIMFFSGFTAKIIIGSIGVVTTLIYMFFFHPKLMNDVFGENRYKVNKRKSNFKGTKQKFVLVNRKTCFIDTIDVELIGTDEENSIDDSINAIDNLVSQMSKKKSS